jgi:outer membrane protein assembly factor BamB
MHFLRSSPAWQRCVVALAACGMLWLAACGPASSSQAVAAPVVTLSSINGSGVGSSAADAFYLTVYDAVTGKVRWRKPVNVGDSATLRATNTSIYLLAEHSLQAYQLATGTRQWLYGPADAQSFFLDIDALTADTLYVTEVEGSSHAEDLVAFDTASGQPRWTFHTGADVLVTATAQDAYSAELGASSDLTQQAPPQSLRAFAAHGNGTPLWNQPVTQFGSFGAVQIGPNGTLYLNSASGLFALHAADGTTKWMTPNPIGGQNAAGGPMIADGALIYASFNDQEMLAMRAADGSVAWKHAFAQLSDFASEHLPCASNGRVVLQWTVNNSANGHVQVLNSQNGAIAWDAGDKTKDLSNQSQVLCDGQSLYLITTSAHAFRLSDGAVRWQSTGITVQNPALAILAQDMLCVAGSDKLYAIDTQTGKARWAASLQKGESLLIIASASAS